MYNLNQLANNPFSDEFDEMAADKAPSLNIVESIRGKNKSKKKKGLSSLAGEDELDSNEFSETALQSIMSFFAPTP